MNNGISRFFCIGHIRNNGAFVAVLFDWCNPQFFSLLENNMLDRTDGDDYSGGYIDVILM